MSIFGLACFLAVSGAAADSLPPQPDSAAVETLRVVKRMEEFVVRSPLDDARSSQSVHLLTSTTLRTLPIESLNEAIALKSGVVARGEQLHVRGGRAGEFRHLLEGIPLNDPARDVPMALPLTAVQSADLVIGGLDAEYGGALAGVLNVRTVDPGEKFDAELLWQTDFRMGTNFDRISGRLGGPIASTGLGVVVSAEATLDDTYLPNLRTESTRQILGLELGWRASNRQLAHVKIARLETPSQLSFQFLADRRVERPFNAMWTLDGWTARCADPMCVLGPVFSPDSLPGFTRYRAADHLTMTDERRLGAILSWVEFERNRRTRLSLGWIQNRSITSLNGLDDESYLSIEQTPQFGFFNSPTSDPFLVYSGSNPFFRKSENDAFSLRGDIAFFDTRGSQIKFGGGANYHSIYLYELDGMEFGRRPGLDSLRTYRAHAPGGFLYGQGRWIFEGLILNGGLRLEYFTPGPEAEAQSFGSATKGLWTLSPRLGVAYPISVRDVLSLSYVRIRQDPARDFLYENRMNVLNRRPLGNPGLVPATVISYQAAVKHLFTARLAAQASVFYRDLFGLVGARFFSEPGARNVRRYESADNGSSRGFELSLLYNSVGRGWIEMHYTYMHARGTQSLEEGDPYGFQRGPRPPPIQINPLHWDRRHLITLSTSWQLTRSLSFSWITRVGSGFPWSPRQRREIDTSLELINSQRFKWEELSDFSVRWAPSYLRGHLIFGLDVRNVFNFRSDVSATLDGYPHLVINTLYDDYGAYRTETGYGGGAYYDDPDGTGNPQWNPVYDPRLLNAPRAIRFTLGTSW